jgi:hypothetical protein
MDLLFAAPSRLAAIAIGTVLGAVLITPWVYPFALSNVLQSNLLTSGMM